MGSLVQFGRPTPSPVGVRVRDDGKANRSSCTSKFSSISQLHQGPGRLLLLFLRSGTVHHQIKKIFHLHLFDVRSGTVTTRLITHSKHPCMCRRHLCDRAVVGESLSREGTGRQCGIRIFNKVRRLQRLRAGRCEANKSIFHQAPPARP